ncbi:spike base protein, RCAP_Rcc01079 family [Yoonia sp.]|uniref:spike base protein, RCAP_Rcc01079 family n=1 Tax=Yoonia sp. TaxID=2212373 RepID=UPI003F6A8839
MPDPFESDYVNLTSPAVTHYAVVPSDGADLPVRPRALFVRVGGTAVLQDKDGTVISYDLSAGAVLSMRPVRVLATGTTAQLVAWY